MLRWCNLLLIYGSIDAELAKCVNEAHMRKLLHPEEKRVVCHGKKPTDGLNLGVRHTSSEAKLMREEAKRLSREADWGPPASTRFKRCHMR